MTLADAVRSGDDAARAAVAPLLDELRGELLVMPRDERRRAAPRHDGVRSAAARHAPLRQDAAPRCRGPRRAAFVFACVSATLASCGLSAAGALPEPLQHITDSIARTLGVPAAARHDARRRTSAAQRARRRPRRRTTSRAPATTPHDAATTPTAPGTPKAPKVTPPTGHAHARRRTPGRQLAQPAQPPIATPRPTQARRSASRPSEAGQAAVEEQRRTRRPASRPTGASCAAAAADASSRACAQADALSPAGCPQVATAAGATAQVAVGALDAAERPAAGRGRRRADEARRHATSAGPARPPSPSTSAFQMDATYTAGRRHARRTSRTAAASAGRDHDVERLGVRRT